MKRVQSPSSINTYFQCPRRYYFIYNLKMRTSPSIHLVRGSITHKILEDFFKIDPSAIENNYRENMQIIVLDMLKKYWANSSSQLAMLNMKDEEIDAFYNETQMMLINWLNQFTNKIDDKIAQGSNFVESFNNFKPKTEIQYTDQELMVRGFIDAIEECDGEIRLMDYKTSKNAHISDEYRTQLAIYALLYEKRHGVRPHKVGIYFLKDTEHLLDVDDELIKHGQFMIEQIHACTDEIDHISDYPKKESGLCKWHSGQCDFYDHCFNGKKIPENSS
ncbi:MAG: PD-(D/E)XK nuclease family protein [Nanoarchaeota archaeon]|nr:PD-(D/E)XK nuclease family protein [Nanoarchaeota archaeon]MCG2718875.1 PD-(D/E)XK nuclease family protein [Nanoarchaeota archaeon]